MLRMYFTGAEALAFQLLGDVRDLLLTASSSSSSPSKPSNGASLATPKEEAKKADDVKNEASSSSSPSSRTTTMRKAKEEHRFLPTPSSSGNAQKIDGNDSVVAIVTGANQGIGFEIARQLALQSLCGGSSPHHHRKNGEPGKGVCLLTHLVLACRDVKAAEDAKRRIEAELVERQKEIASNLKEGEPILSGGRSSILPLDEEEEEEKKELSLIVIRLDLASFDSIHAFAETFLSLKLPLHYLFNNAGVMFPPYETTADGHELQWGVNYLGPFLLTQLLFPCMLSSSSAASSTSSPSQGKIVNISSVAHEICSSRQLQSLLEEYRGALSDLQSQDDNNNPLDTNPSIPPSQASPPLLPFDLHKMNSHARYNSHFEYGRSKYALIMFTYKLQRMLKQFNANLEALAVHPGIVNTSLYRHVNCLFRAANRCGGPFFMWSPALAASRIVACALTPREESSLFSYYFKGKLIPSEVGTYDEKMQDDLWDLSVQLTLSPSMTPTDDDE